MDHCYRIGGEWIAILSPHTEFVCVVLFLQNVIVTLLAQSMIAVMKMEFASVRRERQGLNVISVCGDITGTYGVVNVSNCPISATHLAACASLCQHVQHLNNSLKKLSATFQNSFCLKLNENIWMEAVNWLCNPFVSICFFMPLPPLSVNAWKNL